MGPRRTFLQSLLAMLGIALVLMLSALDQTVIGNALPSIVADLQGFELYAWIATGYLLASIITIPIFGRLGDYYGRKPFVLLAAFVFTLASLLCALAPSMQWLVVGRAAQGIGGGILIGTAFACIPELFPDTRERLRWQMLLSAAFSVVNAAGPSLGGLLTQAYGWRSVFYINLPLGAVAIFCVWRYLPHIKPAQPSPGKLDYWGACLIALSLGGLQLFVEWVLHGKEWQASLAVGAVAFAAGCGLWFWERKASNPLLPMELFQNATMRCLFLLSVLSGAVMFVLLFYLPLLFQGGFNLSPREAGLLITPLALFITLGAILNGRIVAKLRNPNLLPLTGFSLLFLTCMALAASGATPHFNYLLGLMFAGGMGFGLIFMNLTLFTQTIAERSMLGIATALLQSLRLVGGLLGTAVFGSVVSYLYRQSIEELFAAHGGSAFVAAFLDPRVLLDVAAREQAVQHLQAAGLDALGLVVGARRVLAESIELGVAGCASLAIWGLWKLSRIPAVRL
jgi:EmrB/QacA subfamily drug resistance transporter